MKKLWILIFATIILISLVGCAKPITSGKINHEYISGVSYTSKDGTNQAFYLFDYRGLLLQVPTNTTSFSVYLKGDKIRVYNIVINSDNTISGDWDENPIFYPPETN